MEETSEMSSQPTSPGTRRFTSSLASVAGPLPSPSPDGLQLGLSGLGRVRVSRTAAPEQAQETTTLETSGPSSAASLRSAALQLSLESRLRARMGVDGSMEYALTWKRWAMPSGRPISALRASGRRTSGSGSGGWPTPVAQDDNKSPEAHLAMRARLPGGARTTITSLQVMAQTAGWTTPQAMEPDAPERPSRAATGRTTDYLGRQVLGATTSSSPAPTVKRGALNPLLPSWMMGFPVYWALYSPR